MSVKQKLFIFAICACAVVESAPRRGSSSTTFDQKQTGEYNIQLHLKDFQIIAVVGDDSFGGLGDYDYNYDYSDFTVKPSTSTSTTTKKPQFLESTPSSSSIESVDFSTLELSNVDLTSKPTSKKPLPSVTHPYPIVSPSTTVKPVLTTTTTTKKPIADEVTKPSLPMVNGNIASILEEIAALTEKVEKVSTSTPSTTLSAAPSSTVKIITSTTPPSLTTVKKVPVTSVRPITVKPQPTPIAPIPGQIPVVVQDFSIVRNETPIVKEKNPESLSTKDKKSDVVTSVTIVPLEDVNLGEVPVNEQPTLGEILHYRRCAQGYQRDKRGRCRKVRRPQIPLGLTRFASTFASRFRHAGNAGFSEASQTESDISDDTVVV